MRKLVVILAILFALPAQADRLLVNSQPAERMRGCTFAETFTSQANVEANAGAVTGAPTFSADSGMTLDGSSDLVVYNLTGRELNSDPITFLFEFSADFNWDSTDAHYFFEDSNTNYRFLKDSSVNNHVLRLYIGGTQIGTVASATYSSLWTVGERHTIIVSSTSGDTDIYFDNTQIMTSDASAWSATAETALTVGARAATTLKFDGTIHSLKVFHAKLTAQEALDYYDFSTFKIIETATGVWDLTMSSHDPVNVETLDTSGNGNDATLGDGSTPGTYPTKITERRGYIFDGSDDYFSGMPALPGSYTVVFMEGDGDVSFENTDTTWNNIKASGSYSGELLYLSLIPSVITTLQENDLTIWLQRKYNEI